MRFPTVTETTPRPEAVTQDTFIAAIGGVRIAEQPRRELQRSA